MAALALPIANISLPQLEASAALSPARVHCLLLGLGFATGMEFYTFDSVNLVLPDLTGTLGVSADAGPALR